MRKKSERIQTVVLVVIFLIGAAAIILPLVTEVASYRQDEEAYEEMAVQYRQPVLSPEPEESPPVQSPAPEATDRVMAELPDTAPVALPHVEPPVIDPDSSGPPVLPSNTAVLPEETDTPAATPTVLPSTARVRSSPAVQSGTTAPATVPTTAAPVETTAPAKTGTDHEACLAQNGDYVAWLTIPGTKINYPVVRSDNTEYYLHHLFSGEESKLGTLFSLTSSDYRTPSRNIAIYGHHLSNSDAMFSTLLNYKSASYCSRHSTILLDTLYGSRTYRVFAVINMTVSDWDAATAAFSGSEAFMRFVNRARLESLFDTDVQVTASDHILTLITCDRSYASESGRLIVMAVEQQEHNEVNGDP